jgi:hypothetical protein
VSAYGPLRVTGLSDEICLGLFDTSKQVGDVNHLQVFASPEAADKWFAEYDSEGVAYEYPVTTRTSPFPRRSIARVSCLRSDFAPLTFSWNIFVDLASLSSATCAVSDCPCSARNPALHYGLRAITTPELIDK